MFGIVVGTWIGRESEDDMRNVFKIMMLESEIEKLRRGCDED